ncbi:alkaline phosphatase PafA [Olivibacter sitiensis]|uniref:alkaline phosphatase PafA n=1 Tax=Olivibacter sitiensis TaxID=376470 RepID=UPI0003F6002B|nr:alkaline phosphatase PafA [Olivibacter sitiensis]
MRFLIPLYLVIHLATLSFAQDNAALKRPKLVVGIMIDQMRWDYLYRYYDRYEQGGFKRLLNEGYSHENTYIDHLPTVTAIGHTTVYTGSVPSIHGITGNDFMYQLEGKVTYCATDTSVSGVGINGSSGQMSPKNLLTSTVTDELKLATNFRSKVIGIAIKDRSSIFPAGHFANAAYWFGNDAKWGTSNYYMDELPAWVKQFNESSLADDYLKNGWHTLYAKESYVQSSPDENPYEGAMKGMNKAVLPIDASILKKNGRGIIRDTPFGNSYTLDFAKAAIHEEQLGNNKNGCTDFLAISLSSTDGIGHQYGVNALEVEDMYLRLDQDLKAFFEFLDNKIGKDEYLIFITADHGASHNNPFFIDHRGGGGYLSLSQERLNHHLDSIYHSPALVRSLMNDQVHLDYALIASKGLNLGNIKATIIDYCRRLPGIAYAVDMDRAGQSTVADPIRRRIVNSYNFKRSGAIQLVFDPQWKGGSDKQTGTGHSAWNPYDAHIPLVWMGWGIPKGGSSNQIASMYDIAPTISALLHIQEPNGNVGHPLSFK